MINKKTLEELQTLWEAQQGQKQPKLPSRLPLDSLEIIPELYQSRTGYEDKHGTANTQHVARLLAALKASHRAELDPIKVLRVGDRNIVVDGHHRLKAYGSTRRQSIPVEFIPESPTNALLVAGAENKKISLPLRSWERSERAWALVQLGPECYSKHDIWKGTGASESTIASMRKKLRELQEAGEEIPDTWREANTNKNRDPEWLEKMIQEWSERITKHFGAPTQFNNGKLGILSDALINWSPRLAQQIALHVVENLGLQDEAEELDRMRREEKASDEAEANAYGF